MSTDPTLTVRRLFDQAVELPRPDRRPFLERVCPDLAMRQQVLRLLEAHHDDTEFLNRSAAPAGPGKSLPHLAQTLTGRRIGPYTIEGEIGQGGMGTVYRAVRADDSYRKSVAIKAVSLGVPEEVFRRERQILASLEHPNIARLLDGGTTDDGTLYFVMELVDGQRIDSYASAGGLSTRERLRLLLPVLDAVSYAHRNLVVHRDLKPANILVAKDGSPRLLDFGVAKVLDPSGGENARTLPGAMTVDYASPEQLRGEPVTTASDIYSLGIVMFELLTRGAKPYQPTGDSLPSRFKAILHEEPRRPSVAASDGLVARELRGELDNIVLRAMAKEPARRYASVDQLRADIEAHLDGRPVSAQGADFWYLAGKAARRHWLPLGAAAAVLLSSTIGAVAFLRQARMAEERRHVAEEATGRAEKLLGEQRRLVSEKETLLADKESLLGTQVKLRALAESEARAALEQRTIAERRLARARELASTMLFDVHDAVRDLKGAGPAREKIVTKTIEQLEGLAKDAPGDTRLAQELAGAYLRAGDMLGGAMLDGADGTNASLAMYEKALAVQSRHRPASAMMWLQLAETRHRISVAMTRGDRGKESAVQAGLARDALVESGRLGGHWPEVDAEIHFNLCHAQSSAGLHGEARQTCPVAIEKLRAIATATKQTAEARQQRASAFQRLALDANGRGDLASALRLLNGAIQEQGALVRDYPENAAYQRVLTAQLSFYARWREAVGGDDALAAYGDAIRSFRTARSDRSRSTMLNLLHAWTAMRYAALLQSKSREADARASARESIGIYEQLMAAPKPGYMEVNDYANELIVCPFRDLCDPAKALALATRAVEMTDGRNAYALDTLANAQFRAGDVAKAVETQRRAVDLSAALPKSATMQLKENLARFEAAARGK